MKIPWAYKSQLRDSLTASLSNLSVLFEQEGKYTLGSVAALKMNIKVFTVAMAIVFIVCIPEGDSFTAGAGGLPKGKRPKAGKRQQVGDTPPFMYVIR